MIYSYNGWISQYKVLGLSQDTRSNLCANPYRDTTLTHK